VIWVQVLGRYSALWAGFARGAHAVSSMSFWVQLEDLSEEADVGCLGCSTALLALQEIHGATAVLATLEHLLPEIQHWDSFLDPAAGGCTLSVRRSFMSGFENLGDPVISEPGRIMLLCCGEAEASCAL